MKTISGKSFVKLLNSENELDHRNLIINFEEPTDIDVTSITKFNRFIGCTFTGSRVDFSNHNEDKELIIHPDLYFEGCDIQNEIYVKDCTLNSFTIAKTNKSIKRLHFASVIIHTIKIECVKKDQTESLFDINLVLNNCEVTHWLFLFGLKSSEAIMINHCKMRSSEILGCSFRNVDIEKNQFSQWFHFKNNKIEYSHFADNIFNKTDFSKTDFGNYSTFSSNDFEGTAIFEKLQNENKTEIKFKSCNFFKYTYFNNSKVDHLDFDTSKFQEIASFQEIEVNSISIDRTIFEKLVFFDDIEIHNLYRCNKRTIRTIKQQLQRADNKIDYDNFRAYELDSYKNVLKAKIKRASKKNKKQFRRDILILRLNTFYSDNGTDWVKALKRTLYVALFFYIPFHIFYNIQHGYPLLENWNANNYIIGFFRYLLITDFSNPLIDDKAYLSNALVWIPFILGKIFIAIGIYEILISFRKFKK